MQLMFAQHGRAESKEENPDRPLTEEGRVETGRVARAVVEVGITVDRVWHSGKLRARQTAEIFADALGGALEERGDLGATDDPAAAVEAARATGDVVLLVGHKPFMERLPGLLLAGDPERSPVQVVYSGVGLLEESGDGWRLRAYLPPGVG